MKLKHSVSLKLKAPMVSATLKATNMSKTFTITMYSDPGHGWGKVKRDVLVNLGIADKITRYSYQRGDYAYLEEDCDLTTLCMALNERDTRVKFVEKRSERDSKIRSYERYEYGFNNVAVSGIS
jgi:hypothetical protein